MQGWWRCGPRGSTLGGPAAPRYAGPVDTRPSRLDPRGLARYRNRTNGRRSSGTEVVPRAGHPAGREARPIPGMRDRLVDALLTIDGDPAPNRWSMRPSQSAPDLARGRRSPTVAWTIRGDRTGRQLIFADLPRARLDRASQRRHARSPGLRLSRRRSGAPVARESRAPWSGAAPYQRAESAVNSRRSSSLRVSRGGGTSVTMVPMRHSSAKVIKAMSADYPRKKQLNTFRINELSADQVFRLSNPVLVLAGLHAQSCFSLHTPLREK